MESSIISNLEQQANSLNSIALMFIKYFCAVIIPFGFIGHLFSFYVFTRPSLRLNSCCIYFLFATIFGTLNTVYVLPMRLIQTNFKYLDPTFYSNFNCKTIWLFIYALRSSAFWFIVLASADRYLCSSRSVVARSWSDVRVAVRVIPVAILINFLVYIQVPIFFVVEISPTTQQPICASTGPVGSSRIALTYVNLVFFGFLPSLSMIVFSSLTWRHVKQQNQVRVTLSNTPQNVQNVNTRKKERQMLQMLFIQVLVYSVTGLAFGITSIITIAINLQSNNVFVVAQGTLANAIVGVVSTTGPCLSFYLFTLSSSLFRKELKGLFTKLFQKNHKQQQQQSIRINTLAAAAIATTKV